MIHAGTERNWKIVGLTHYNTVIVHTDGDDRPHDSHERPSEWFIDYLTPKEKRILRRGLTKGGKDRRRPRRPPER